jgi:N-acetylglucosaminyldiphosphoundecaprenol N-acetyl-beta-D-mannosaminyltransferase
MRHRLRNFIDYTLFSKALTNLPSKTSSLLVNTINQYSYCIAQKDSYFKKSLQNSDVLLPDGIGAVAAARLLTGQKIKKIAGADVHHYLLDKLNRSGGSCFYLGASEQTLQKIRERIHREYPNIQVETYSPPFKPKFNKQDDEKMISAVNSFEPEVLFVGMTAPKQEKWAYRHKKEIHAKIICTIGAVFDFYAGTIERPGKLWIQLGLEWFIRLIKEPKRMWKRYLYFGPIFIWLMIKEKMKLVKNMMKSDSRGSRSLTRQIVKV